MRRPTKISCWNRVERGLLLLHFHPFCKYNLFFCLLVWIFMIKSYLPRYTDISLLGIKWIIGNHSQFDRVWNLNYCNFCHLTVPHEQIYVWLCEWLADLYGDPKLKQMHVFSPFWKKKSHISPKNFPQNLLWHCWHILTLVLNPTIVISILILPP